MKKILLSIFVLCGFSIVLSAQEQGKLWLGGGVNFSTSKTDSLDRAYSYSVSPEIGYQFSNKWGAGLAVGYFYRESAYSGSHGNYKNESSSFSISPFVRYSFLKSDIGSLFVDGGATYFWSKYEDNYPTDPDESKNTGFGVGIRPGAMFNISSKVSLVVKLGYLGYTHNKSREKSTDEFGLNFSLNDITFGVNIFL